MGLAAFCESLAALPAERTISLARYRSRSTLLPAYGFQDALRLTLGLKPSARIAAAMSAGLAEHSIPSPVAAH